MNQIDKNLIKMQFRALASLIKCAGKQTTETTWLWHNEDFSISYFLTECPDQVRIESSEGDFVWYNGQDTPTFYFR